MERKHIQAKVHPDVLNEMKSIRLTFKFGGWGAVIEQMAKVLWPNKFDKLEPGKYERDNPDDNE